MTQPAAATPGVDAIRAGAPKARRGRAALLALACLGLAWPLLAAAPARVVVVAEDSALHREITAAAGARLRELGSPATLEIRAAGTPLEAMSPAPSLLVSVGSHVARALDGSALAVPLLHAAVPESVFGPLHAARGEADRHRHTALLLDQPPARQLRLLRLALPHFTRIGVLSRTGSEPLLEDLRASASAQGAELLVARVEQPRLLLTRLNELLQRVDALLVTPDPELYNQVTLENVLLTSYHQRKPVIGLSAAYVRAGALLAVHSEPADLGRDLGDLIDRLLAGGRLAQLPGPAYPRRFSVTVNAHVAGALGLDRILPETGQLERMLRDAERTP